MYVKVLTRLEQAFEDPPGAWRYWIEAATCRTIFTICHQKLKNKYMRTICTSTIVVCSAGPNPLLQSAFIWYKILVIQRLGEK